MSQLDEMIDSHPIPTWRPVAWPVMIMLSVLLIWANFAELDEVSIATGVVVPEGKIKVIQHLEGGIIEQIHVADGDRVRKGDHLIRLNLATSGVNRKELQARLDGQILVRARLLAEASGKPLSFPPDVAQRWPDQVIAQHKAYNARRRELEFTLGVIREQVKQKELAVKELIGKRRNLENRQREMAAPTGSLRQQVRQKKLEVQELEAELRAVSTNLALAERRFEMSKQLLADGLTPKMDHLELEAEVRSLLGEKQTLIASIPRARAAVDEAKAGVKEELKSIGDEIEGISLELATAKAAITEVRERLKEAAIRFRREAQEELGKSEQSVSRLRTLIVEATEQKGRADIRSPIDGIIKNLRFNTIGGVVRPGDAILEIVPTGDNLVIDARLNPTDRGYVEKGQAAVVKVSTYDFVRYGGLDGRVILVGSDSSMDENGSPYFRVVVKTAKTYLGEEDGRLPITPGMEATVDIHTGRKTVMDYLIRPVLKLRYEAFRER